MARRKSRYSGIGGQAVLEGVMMKNKEKYAVAVRKPDGEIEVEVETYQGLAHGSKFKELPFIRGIFNFLDSLILGTRALNYSASFYEEEEGKETKFDKAMDKMSGGNGEKLLSGIVTVISIMLAVGIFIVLPYFISSLFESFIRNRSLMAIIEGVIRIALFLLYVWGISAMKDIRRLYQYHGAEHKCINCIEKGRPLTVHNVMRSSRLHKRCGTSFIFFVMLVSIVLFFFIQVDNVAEKVILRILVHILLQSDHLLLLGRPEQQQVAQQLGVHAVVGVSTELDLTAELLPEFLILLAVVGQHGVQLVLDLLFQSVVDQLELVVLLQHLAADIQAQILTVHDALDEAEVIGQQVSALLHDEHAGCVQGQTLLVILGVEIIASGHFPRREDPERRAGQGLLRIYLQWNRQRAQLRLCPFLRFSLYGRGFCINSRKMLK